jgi:hypothetical protein
VADKSTVDAGDDDDNDDDEEEQDAVADNNNDDDDDDDEQPLSSVAPADSAVICVSVESWSVALFVFIWHPRTRSLVRLSWPMPVLLRAPGARR